MTLLLSLWTEAASNEPFQYNSCSYIEKLEYGSSVFVSGFPVDDQQSLAGGKPRLLMAQYKHMGLPNLKYWMHNWFSRQIPLSA